MLTKFFKALSLLVSLSAFADSSLTTISESGSSRATAYTMSSKIIRVGDQTHVTYLGYGEQIFVKTLNHKSGTWSGPVLIGSAVDNHGAPTLAADGQGFLHIVYGPHHGEFKYRVSVRANDSSAWAPETRFGLNGTYASILIDASDTMHVVYRGGNASFENLKLMYQNKSLRAQTWSMPVVLADGGHMSVSYDSSIALGPDQSLNVGFQFFDHAAAGGRRIGFMKSTDAGRSWTRMNGQPQAIPATYNTAQAIADSPKADLRASKVVMDSKGNAYLTISNLKIIPKSTSLIKINLNGVVNTLDLRSFLGANEDFDAYSILTVDSLDRVWVAAPFVKRGDSWGGKSTGIKVLRLNSGVMALSALKTISNLVAPKAKPEPYWLPVFEHFNGHNEMTDSPGLLFTRGYGNSSSSLGTSIPTSVLYKSIW